MSSLGKRRAPYSAISKRVKTSMGRQAATFRRSAAMSGRYNRSMSARLQRAPGMSRETGFVDLANAAYALDTTGSVTLIATVAQGASVNQRVGKRIVWKSVQIRGNMSNNVVATNNDCVFLIVYDKRPTGALPAITDILVSASSAAFNNDANSGRFEIIRRVDKAMSGNNTAASNLTESSYISVDQYIDLKGRPCAFKAAGTGAIGDIEQGALYLVTVGNTVAGTAAATANLAFRTRFLDV